MNRLSTKMQDMLAKVTGKKLNTEARKAALIAIMARGRAAHALQQSGEFNAFFAPKLEEMRKQYGVICMSWNPLVAGTEKDPAKVAMNTAFMSGMNHAFDLIADIIPTAILKAEVAGEELKKLEEFKK